MCELQLESRFVIPWRVIFISGMDGYGDVPLSGILLKSSTVKTGLKYLLKFSAFSDGSVAVMPSELVRVLILEMPLRFEIMPKRFRIVVFKGYYIVKVFFMMMTLRDILLEFLKTCLQTRLKLLAGGISWLCYKLTVSS